MGKPEELNQTGHDLHFLSRLDRVEASQTDLALRLYRSPELVRRLFADATCPADAERIAVPVQEGDAPPHVIIARSGAFVTCLASHMKLHDVPPLAYDRLAIHLRRDERERQQRARADEVAELPHADNLLLRTHDAGPGLTREEFLELAALSPLLHFHYCSQFLKLLARVTERDHVIARMKLPLRAIEEPVVRGYWRFYHGLGHLALLSGVQGKEGFLDAQRAVPQVDLFELFLNATRVGFLPNALRVFWTLSRAGKLAMPTLKRLLDESANIVQWVPAALALVGVAARHRGLRTEALGLINPSRVPDADATPQVGTAIKSLGTWIGKVIDETPDDPDELVNYVAAMNTTYFGESPPPDRPDLVYAFAANRPMDYIFDADGLSQSMALVSVLCRVPPELFYHPAADIHLAPRYSPEATLALPCFYVAPDPVVAKPKIGRNDPCPCNSGKKYKKCCEGKT